MWPQTGAAFLHSFGGKFNEAMVADDVVKLETYYKNNGYRNVHDACYDVGKYLAAEVVKLGPFELLCDSDPLKGIPSVAWRIAAGERNPFVRKTLAPGRARAGGHGRPSTLS